MAEQQRQDGRERFRERLRTAVHRIKKTETMPLIIRIATTADPVILWALHLELDRRDVLPCLRWPARDDTTQHEFVTWLADMLWLARRHPTHEPQFRGWRDLFGRPPGSNEWHAAMARQYFHAARHRSLAYWCANGLGLSDEQRQNLMMLPTATMCAARRVLHPEAFAQVGFALLSHAMAKPDRSGQHKPDDVANRRGDMFRTWVLSGKSPTLTAANWKILTGQHLSRQVISRQMEATLAVIEGQAPFV
jgi:hypothetical protein